MNYILPPYLFVLFALMMTFYSYANSPTLYISLPYSGVGFFVLIFGIAIAAKGKRYFAENNSNIHTFGQPNKLVTTGMFNYSRNPMYLGFVIALLGVCILNGLAIEHLAMQFLFILIVRYWYIAFEEKIMLETFGSDYKHYCMQVRRWF